MEIAVCEDDGRELEKTLAMLERYRPAGRETGCAARGFARPSRLCAQLDAGAKFDVFLLDILMPEMDGIELGRLVRERMPDAYIVYLTSSKDYALSSYSVYAFQYLLKPVEEDALYEVLDRIAAGLAGAVKKVWAVKTASGLRVLEHSSIRYVECLNRAVLYALGGGETVRSLTIREPFGKVIDGLLQDRRFLKTAASFAVNMDYIRTVGKNYFLLDNGVKLPISRQHVQECRQKYLDYLLEGRNGSYVV